MQLKNNDKNKKSKLFFIIKKHHLPLKMVLIHLSTGLHGHVLITELHQHCVSTAQCQTSQHC